MAKNKKDIPPESEPETAAAAEAAPEVETVTLTKEEAEEVKKLLAETEAQTKKLEEAKDQYMRLLAEYDNYRKRTLKEKETLYLDGKADAAAALLPVFDNLERALKQTTQDQALYKGIEMTMTQLVDIFKKLGVEEIPAEGQPFDPNFHSGVMHVEDEALGENVVCEVFQRGFKMGGKILRFAMVKVAN